VGKNTWAVWSTVGLLVSSVIYFGIGDFLAQGRENAHPMALRIKEPTPFSGLYLEAKPAALEVEAGKSIGVQLTITNNSQQSVTIDQRMLFLWNVRVAVEAADSDVYWNSAWGVLCRVAPASSEDLKRLNVGRSFVTEESFCDGFRITDPGFYRVQFRLRPIGQNEYLKALGAKDFFSDELFAEPFTIEVRGAK
jgi:hypothetical protein